DVKLASSGTVVSAAAAGDAVPGVGDRVVLAVRSERIEMRADASAENVVRARVRSVVYGGAEYDYILDTPEGEMRASSARPVLDVEVTLRLPPDAIVVLAESTSA